MSLNSTPSGERINIGIFGRRNAGKSSLINVLTSQSISIVSDIAGTTTDPVSKAMELLPLGPVLITDTPGFDDDGDLGTLRVEKALQVLRKCDFVILVLDSGDELNIDIYDFINEVKKRDIPYIICINKCDSYDGNIIWCELIEKYSLNKDSVICISAKTGLGISELKNRISSFNIKNDKHIIADLINPGDVIVLVVPIDSSAPKGRLILPQQQVIRDALEASATIVVSKETELEETLSKLSQKPKAVITDSQAFEYVSKIVPEDVYLTSFSILMSRYKGNLEWQVNGAKAVENLKNGAKILISEGCTHHRQCGDIGTVKIPKWLRKYTNKEFVYEFTSGGEFPSDLSGYDLIIHCGGCTLNEQEMKYRISKAAEYGVPITNYGVIISYMNGILERTLDLLTLSGK